MGRKTLFFVTAMAAVMLLAAGMALGAITAVKGGAINQVSVVRGRMLPRSTTRRRSRTFPAPRQRSPSRGGERSLILARYSAETICHIVEGTTNTGDNKCSVRIMVVNNATEQQVEARPCNQFTNFAFDSTSGGTETVLAQESHSMDRSVVVGRGTYTVKAQWAVTHTEVRFRVDYWSLTAEKARATT